VTADDFGDDSVLQDDGRRTGDPLDEGYSPPERPRELDEFGTTAEEEEEGESLSGRLAREEADVSDSDDGDGLGDESDTDGELRDDEVGDRRAGRLISFDEDAEFNTDEELHASDVGIDGGASSAEEAAVHIVDDDSDE
jgi:uncharacterized protein DUF5709